MPHITPLKVNPDLIEGHRYEVIHQAGHQKYARRSVMTYLSSNHSILFFNARPLAGTQHMPKEWVRQIIEVDRTDKIELNERAPEDWKKVTQ